MRRASASIRKSYSCNKDLLVAEYVAVKGLGDAAQLDEAAVSVLFDEAVKYLHVMLLRDLRPPWLMHKFPQALPGEGLLSR